MKKEVDSVREIVSHRMATIRRVVMQVPANDQLPWLAFIRNLLILELRGLKVPLDTEPEVRKNQSGRMQIVRGNPSEFRVSDFFCHMLAKLKEVLKLDDTQFNDAIDNFLIHEIVHRGQGRAMGSGLVSCIKPCYTSERSLLRPPL